ncbi:MAG TPA: hypothetical protein VGR37_21085 [Longimicrobiaceae bacterium]|nr:hypothetical protein [Longimicrobiaceae bacterium]
MSIRHALLTGLLLASVPACAGKSTPEAMPRGSLANAPCDPRLVASVLNTDEPLTREERSYLQRCGVRFASTTVGTPEN